VREGPYDGIGVGAERPHASPLSHTFPRLVLLNLVTSAAHFAHNAAYLETYPGPPWISGPGVVVAAWLGIAGVLLLGYRWFERGHRAKALGAIAIFSVATMLGFAHYLYGAPSRHHTGANVTIVCEAVAGAVLLVYSLGRLRGSAPIEATT
jgi:hypothetical protein